MDTIPLTATGAVWSNAFGLRPSAISTGPRLLILCRFRHSKVVTLFTKVKNRTAQQNLWQNELSRGEMT